MKKIKNYGVTTLHVEELFGYLKQVETETARRGVIRLSETS